MAASLELGSCAGVRRKRHDAAGVVKELAAAPYTVLGWDVPDIEETAKALAAAGVSLTQF
jgi:hypothetical protein